MPGLKSDMATCKGKGNRSPRETIKAYCWECTASKRAEVISCDGDGSNPAYHQCAFHPYRTGKKRPSVKIMRKFCMECMGGSAALVSNCETTDCLIYLYRFGKNPARTGKGHFAQRAACANVRKLGLNGGFFI